MNIISQIRKSFRSKRRLVGSNSGFALIGLVITMIIFTILGAAILKIFSSSAMTEVSTNLAHKALFMAESGFRYAASQYLNAESGSGENRDHALTMMDNVSTYPSPPDPPAFDLKISSYFYQYNNSATVNAFGTVPQGIPTSSSGSGKVGIFTGSDFKQLVEYTGYTKATPTSILFEGGTWPMEGTRLFSVVRSEEGTISLPLTESITLNSTDDLSLLPSVNGSFRIYSNPNDLNIKPTIKYGDLFQYKTLNGNQLKKISRIKGDTSTAISIAAGDFIVFGRFIDITSTGKVGGDTSNTFATRKLTYQIPVEAFSSYMSDTSGQQNLFDLDPDSPKWLIQRPEFEVIPDDKKNVAVEQDPSNTGNPKISIKLNTGGLDPPDRVFINLNWWRLPDINFNDAYIKQGETLSYDVQLKVAVGKSNQYNNFLAGITFRVQSNNMENNKYYGASFFHLDGTTTVDKYPSWLPATDPLRSLTPNTYLNAYLVFWKSENGVRTVLGSSPLDFTKINPTQLNPTIDWATIVVRITETILSPYQTIKILIYNKNQSQLGQPIVWPSSTGWASADITMNETSTGFLTSDLDPDPADPESYTIQKPYPDTEACESGIGCTGILGRPEVGVHIFADKGSDMGIFLDDFALYMPGASTVAGDIGFLPGTVTQ